MVEYSKNRGGKRAVITGANSSIGKGIATIFAEHGADVVISYRSDEPGATHTVRKIQEVGCSGKAIYADFSQPEKIDQFFKEAL